MRVELGAASITVAPGGAAELTVEVFNERTVIDGVTARVMGLDAQWVKARPGRLALFPDTAGTIELRLTVPEEFPAGTHVVAVEVTSSVDPLDVVVVPLELVVRPATDAFVVVEPGRLVARRDATFTATVENSGNTRLELALVASDPDRALAFTFDPKVVEVPPGEAVTSQVEVEARTRLFGSNLDRQFNVSASSRDASYDAHGVFVHQPVVPRGVLTAAMLAAIVGLWALIFLVILGTILDGEEPEKAAPASFFATSEEVLAASGGTSAQAKFVTPAMGASVAGVVVSTSTGEPVGRITVDAVRTTPDGPVTVASAASDDEGAYRLGGLPPGEYSVRFSAPGFEEVWYPAAPSRTGAEAFRVAAFEVVEGKDAAVTGLPGSLAGVVDTGAPLGTVPVSVDVRPVVGGVPGDVVATVGTDDQNAFAAAGLPTPGLYELTFSAAGYQPTTAVERLGGGENRLTTSIRLSAGDGSISGVVTDGLQPLGGVTITVTSGELNLTTATPTSGSVGRFSLSGLPTPATYLITFSREGFGFESVAVELGPGQQRTDVDVELVRGTGSVTGRVTDSGGQGLGRRARHRVRQRQHRHHVDPHGRWHRHVLRRRPLDAWALHAHLPARRVRPPDRGRRPRGQRLRVRRRRRPLAHRRDPRRNRPVLRQRRRPRRRADLADRRADGAVDHVGHGAGGELRAERAGAGFVRGLLHHGRLLDPDPPRRDHRRRRGDPRRHPAVEQRELSVIVDVSPGTLEATPGLPVVLLVTVTNTEAVIAAYELSVLGVDPDWVTIEDPRPSLFPDGMKVVAVTITLPTGVPAGMRRLAVQVREVTAPGGVETVPVEVDIPAEVTTRIELDPPTVTAGKSATMGIILRNEGNQPEEVELSAVDEEDKVTFAFEPVLVRVEPGEEVVSSVELRARRPFTGSPKLRQFEVTATGAVSEPVVTRGVFVQKPVLSRGGLGLLGLLAAITVFAAVIATTFGAVVDRSKADRELLLDAIRAANSDGLSTTPGSVTGTVLQATTGLPLDGVVVDAFPLDDPSTSAGTTATTATGTYELEALPEGDYKLRFRGAGFTDVWFPEAIEPTTADPVTVVSGEATPGIDVRLGGIPASLAGTIAGDDPAGATVAVHLPMGTAQPLGAARARAGGPSSGGPARPAGGHLDGRRRLRRVPARRDPVTRHLFVGRVEGGLRHRGAAGEPGPGRGPRRGRDAAAPGRRRDQRHRADRGRPARRRHHHRVGRPDHGHHVVAHP